MRVVTCLAAVALTGSSVLAISPASAQVPGEANAGSPYMKCMDVEPYYLRTGSDPASGVLRPGVLSQDPPDGEGGAPAVAALGRWYLGNVPVVGEVRSHQVAWAGSVEGDLCHDVELTLFHTSVNSDPTLDGWTLDLRLLADGELAMSDVVDAPFTTTPESLTATATVPLSQVVSVSSELEVQLDMSYLSMQSLIYYDAADYPSQVRVRMWQPCEVDDPHRDCVAGPQFAALRDQLTAFAAEGQVSEDGQARLTGVLDNAETAWKTGDYDLSILELQRFQQAASHPVSAPGEVARTELTAAAGRLITALQSD